MDILAIKGLQWVRNDKEAYEGTRQQEGKLGAWSSAELNTSHINSVRTKEFIPGLSSAFVIVQGQGLDKG